jgi:glycosyltransferase involved in cell wall biosynthesis
MTIIVNDFGNRTGIGRYTNDLGRSLGDNGKVYSLIYSRDNLNNYYPGIKVRGIYPKFFSSGWFINLNFQRLAFWDFINNVKLSGENVHFSNIGIKPFLINEHTSVTMFDLIFLKKEFNGDKKKTYYIRHLKDYKKTKRIITISNYVKSDLENEGFDGYIEVIYPSVSDSFRFLDQKRLMRKKFGLPLEKKLVLSISTTEYRKNIKTVSETMNLLGDKFALVRVGGGLDHCYKFSNLTDEGLNDLYNACDVLLFPSLEEGFGYPVVEAFSSGLPVVASNIEVLREVAGDNAVLVNPYPLDCSKGVRDALSQESELRSRGLNRSKQFSFEVFKRKVTSFFNIK